MSNYLLTITGISLVILLHELGHYLVARACGMRVLRFSLGFGPRLWERRFGETQWQVAALPIGAFVQIDGMGPPDPDAPPEDAHSYRNSPRWQRALVMVAGPASNWMFAAVFLGVLALTVGFTTYDWSSTGIGEVVGDSPAARAGLQVDDRIAAIDGVTVQSWNDMAALIQEHGDQTITLTVERGERRLSLRATPAGGRIGVGPRRQTIRLGAAESIPGAFRAAWGLTAQQVRLLWGLVSGGVEGRLSGLPGMVKILSAEASRGLEYLLYSLASLSVGLTLLNLLPLPALDGGRLVFLGVEAVRRRPNNPEVEGLIHGVGLMLLLAFIVVISVLDLIHW